MTSETMALDDAFGSALGGLKRNEDGLIIVGTYHAVFRDPDGTVVREVTFDNLVTDLGAQYLLNQLAASPTATTAYLGLIGSGGGTTVAVTDTQSSHSGWAEGGAAYAPTYTAPRKTISWNAASGSGAGNRIKTAGGTTYVFSFTGSGTVNGAFVNLNGSSTIDNTTGTMFSAGMFTGQAVTSSSTLTVTYQIAV